MLASLGLEKLLQINKKKKKKKRTQLRKKIGVGNGQVVYRGSTNGK